MPVRILLLFLLFGLAANRASGGEADIVVAVREVGEGFVAEASIRAPVRPQTAWEVLVDYDHMTSIMSNLSASRIASRKDNILIVTQQGVARFGLFSYPFQVEREIRLEPKQRIVTRNLSGSMKRMESEVRLIPAADGHTVRIEYHAEFVFGSVLAGLFGLSFLRHEVEEQFIAMIAEMKRRDATMISGAP